MDPRDFFAASRVIIVAGKGGVGKTAVAAALCRAAASTGLDTLLVEVAGASASRWAFDASGPLGYEEQVLLAPSGSSPGRVRARSITPDEALVDYLEGQGMRRIARRLAASGALEVVATATPGIKDLLVLGKIKQLANEPAADVIVVDAPAAGHAISFLRAPSALLDTARVGAIAQQAADVLALVQDGAKCQVVLVTLPEETPVNELVETAYALEDEIGLRLGPVVVNGVYPRLAGLDEAAATAARGARRRYRPEALAALDAAASLRLERQRLQAAEIDRLAAALPLERIELPFCFTPALRVAESERLALAVLDGIAGLVHAVAR